MGARTGLAMAVLGPINGQLSERIDETRTHRGRWPRLCRSAAGGGAGAAAFLVLEGLFGRQIDRMTQYHYSVTGSWAEPEIELLGADSAQVALDVPSPRGGG